MSERLLNVCHITNLKSWAGVPSRLLEYLQHQQGIHFRHFVISTSGNPDIIEAVRDLEVPVFVPPRRFQLDPRAIWHMAVWMRECQIDIIHSRGSPGNCWGGLAARLIGVPVKIAGEHGMINLPRELKWAIEPWIDRTSDRVIANSEATKLMLMHRFKLPPEKIQVIYDSVYVSSPKRTVTDIRQELGLRADALLVGNVARLETLKDHFTLIEAARIIGQTRHDVQFLIVGGGILEAELNELIAQHNLQDQVKLLGWRRDVPDLLRILDVFVSTSISEPLGNALIEAMVAGLPVIAPAVDGIPEYVVDGETGLLLDPVDPVRPPQTVGAEPVPEKVVIKGAISAPRSVSAAALAHRIGGLLDDPDQRARLGQQAQQKLKTQFAIERYIQEIESLYLQLAHEKGLMRAQSVS